MENRRDHKDRSMEIDGRPIFQQKPVDLIGNFDSQFQDLSFHKIWGGHHLNHAHGNCSLIDGGAPLGSVRQDSAISFSRRRRRGPRSELASLRRSSPKYCRALPDISLGESGDILSEINDSSQPHSNNNILQKSTPNIAVPNSNMEVISIFTINIQCLLARTDELTWFLHEHRPFLFFQFKRHG